MPGGQGGGDTVAVEGVSVRELLLKEELCLVWGRTESWVDARKFMGVVIGFETFSISR